MEIAGAGLKFGEQAGYLPRHSSPARPVPRYIAPTRSMAAELAEERIYVARFAANAEVSNSQSPTPRDPHHHKGQRWHILASRILLCRVADLVHLQALYRLDPVQEKDRCQNPLDKSPGALVRNVTRSGFPAKVKQRGGVGQGCTAALRHSYKQPIGQGLSGSAWARLNDDHGHFLISARVMFLV